MPQPRPYVPIAGTWARSRHDHENAWYRRGSPFDQVMAGHGYERVEQDRDPNRPDDGYWSGAVNGLLIQWFAWWRDRHPAWRTGGETLRAFLRGRRRELNEAGGVTIVAHSHGGQVLAYALAEMHTDICPIHVVTVDMPVRRDMNGVYGRAAARCRHWVHLYSERGWKSRFPVARQPLRTPNARCRPTQPQGDRRTQRHSRRCPAHWAVGRDPVEPATADRSGARRTGGGAGVTRRGWQHGRRARPPGRCADQQLKQRWLFTAPRLSSSAIVSGNGWMRWTGPLAMSTVVCPIRLTSVTSTPRTTR